MTVDKTESYRRPSRQEEQSDISVFASGSGRTTEGHLQAGRG